MDLRKDINFIPATDILNEVENDLRVYFERSVLDKSHLYPVIRDCVSKLGSRVYPVGNTIIYISEYNGFLPKDFHKLILALGCFTYVIEGTPNENPQLYDITEKQMEDYLISKPSETCLDECGENFYVIQRFDTFNVKYTDYAPLSVSKTSYNYCVNNCFNKQVLGQSQFEIANGKIYTGFESGYIYMDYLQKPEKETVDGMDLLIPDFAAFREWIKAACIKKCFEVLYYNNDADVQQRLRYANEEVTKLETRARTVARQAELSDLYEVRKVFFGRYNKFSQMIYGRGK